MNGNAFGFSPYPQRPSVAPSQVGAALAQRQLSATQPAAMPRPQSPLDFSIGKTQDNVPSGGSDDVPSAVHIMAREASRRAPAATLGEQPTPSAPFSQQQLTNFGISDAEMQLLRLQGVIR